VLQLDGELILALHDEGFEVGVETNGTQSPPAGIDWLCVSPKAAADLIIRSGNELKLVFPQEQARPESFQDLDFEHFFLQPMDGPNVEVNTRLSLEYCLSHPQWRLSIQTHKVLKIP
jgi:organic radical activating enzyme